MTGGMEGSSHDAWETCRKCLVNVATVTMQTVMLMVGMGDEDADLNSSCCHFLLSLHLSSFPKRGVKSSEMLVQLREVLQ